MNSKALIAKIENIMATLSEANDIVAAARVKAEKIRDDILNQLSEEEDRIIEEIRGNTPLIEIIKDEFDLISTDDVEDYVMNDSYMYRNLIQNAIDDGKLCISIDDYSF